MRFCGAFMSQCATATGARCRQQIENEHIEDNGDSFRISYDVTHRQGEIDFPLARRNQGESDGTITFAMDGVAHSTFMRNRIGFCVLHPLHVPVRAVVWKPLMGKRSQANCRFSSSPMRRLKT
jgi:hypothetical protein